MKKRWLAMVMALTMVLSLLPVSALATGTDATTDLGTSVSEGGTDNTTEVPEDSSPQPAEPDESSYVAKIGENTYTNIDEAIQSAGDGATIELTQNVVATKSFDKDLTFTGNGVLRMDVYGWYYKHTLTFDGSNVGLECITTGNAQKADEEQKWLTLCLGGTLKFSNGAHGKFEFDSNNGTNCAIYSQEGTSPNIIVENGSVFEVYGKNTKGVTGQGIQLGTTANTGIFVTGGSTFLIDGTNRGYVNSPTVYVKDSVFTVQNCTSNASNGGEFTAINSKISYLNNRGHGLSTSNATIKGSTVKLEGNGYCGFANNGDLTIEDNSTVDITGNGWNNLNGQAALRQGGQGIVKNGVILNVSDNYCTGIYVNKTTGSLTVESGVDLDIVRNGKLTESGTRLTTTGGGIWNIGTMSIPSNTVLYNNHASVAGDDIYSTGTITFGPVGSGWALDGDPDCTDKIDGWYDDSENTTIDEGEAVSNRWEAHEKPYHVKEFTDFTDGVATVTGVKALKAAHGLIGSIVGTVFEDIGRDNKYVSEATENVKADKVFANVTVELWQNGEKIAETTTNANGEYRFDELAPGEYEVRIAKTPDGMNRDCAVVDDEQGNKFEDNAAVVKVKANDETRANAGFYYKSSGGGGGNTKPPVLNTEDHYGYIIGYPEDYETGEKTNDQTRMPVKPEGSITRAEVATIFFRLLTDDARNEYWSQTSSYADVEADDWFNNAICTLSKAGILDGYEDGTFRPNGKITRAEFATIASRFFQYVDKNIENPFSDVEEGAWYYQYIMAASDMGLINGYPDGTFQPNNPITRAESCAIVNRTLDRHPDQEHFLEDMLVWVDNMDTEKWYYEDMQEATNSHEYQMKTSSDGKYEVWTKMLPIRDWAAFEKEWSDANSAAGGEVVK